MKRRTFFKTTAISGSAVALTGLTACETTPTKSQPADFSSFDLNEVSVIELQRRMSTGEMTSEEICKMYLERINLLNPVL